MIRPKEFREFKIMQRNVTNIKFKSVLINQINISDILLSKTFAIDIYMYVVLLSLCKHSVFVFELYVRASC